MKIQCNILWPLLFFLIFNLVIELVRSPIQYKLKWALSVLWKVRNEGYWSKREKPNHFKMVLICFHIFFLVLFFNILLLLLLSIEYGKWYRFQCICIPIQTIDFCRNGTLVIFIFFCNKIEPHRINICNRNSIIIIFTQRCDFLNAIEALKLHTILLCYINSRCIRMFTY